MSRPGYPIYLTANHAKRDLRQRPLLAQSGLNMGRQVRSKRRAEVSLTFMLTPLSYNKWILKVLLN